jgi:drug/metabolite transporter superfamily protein YnfA
MRVLVKRFKLAVFGILPSASHKMARGRVGQHHGGSDNFMN